jgi:hypothetical protein
MPNYQKGLVYKICCLDPNITSCYVGSTTDIVNRRRSHKSRCNKPESEHYDYLVYKFIRDNGGWNNWRVMVIEEYPCNSKIELKNRERYWLELLKAELNSYVPTRTQRECIDENIDRYKEMWKKYAELNKEKIAQNSKEYRELNKEKIAQKKKEYRELNKEKIAQKKKEKTECPICFLMLNRQCLNLHTKRVHSV